jgi:hypothetical protein
MQSVIAKPSDASYLDTPEPTREAAVSAVSWAAIIGGAVAAAATTLVLVALGSGLGLASISPWHNAGASAVTFTIGAGIWLIVVQWLSSALGGYLTGRLRTKWVGTHTHEVFFRDTAHGFLTWALASVIGALILAAAISSGVGTATQAVATAASGAAQGAGSAASSGQQSRAYDVDTLYRGEKPEMAASDPAVRAETTRILATGITNGDVSQADRGYLAQLIASRTGISQDDAQKRVDNVVTQEKAAEAKARQAADTARKSASYVSIFTALSMVIGAFIASAAAALGGSLRDEV